MTDELDKEIYEIVDNLHEYCPDCEHPVCVNGKKIAKNAIQALIDRECNKARQEEQERYQQALNAIVNLKHDYIKYERLIAELSNKEDITIAPVKKFKGKPTTELKGSGKSLVEEWNNNG